MIIYLFFLLFKIGKTKKRNKIEKIFERKTFSRTLRNYPDFKM